MSSAIDRHSFLVGDLDSDSIQSAILRFMLEQKEAYAREYPDRDPRDHRMAYSEDEFFSICHPYGKGTIKPALDNLVRDRILECRSNKNLRFYRLVG